MSNDRYMPGTGNRNGMPDNEENATDLFSGLSEPASPAGQAPKKKEPAVTEQKTAPKPTVSEKPAPRSVQNTPPVRPKEPAARTHVQNDPPVKSPAPQPKWEASPMDQAGKDEDAYKGDFRKLVRNLVLIAIGVLAAVALIVFAVFQHIRYGRKSGGSSSNGEISQISEETEEYDGQELFGVIEAVNVEAGDVTVYSAETGESSVFNLNRADNITDQYGEEIAVSSLHRGQVVNVQYNAADDQVSLFRITSRVTKLSDAFGAVISGDRMSVAGGSYSLDDHLICMYQGEEFDVSELGEDHVFTAMILDGHIYTIYVTHSTGKLRLENYDEYIGGTMTLTSVTGVKSDPIEITANMNAVDAIEGMNTVTITLDSATAYSGKIFIVGEEVRTLKLPESAKRTGSVKLVANPESATIVIDGQYYAAGETIELEYGQHTLQASAYGYTDLEKTITVTQPYQRMLITLTNSTTNVSISSALSNSAVYIDGTYQGTAPLNVSLEPGTYTVTLVTPGYYDASMSVTINSGDLEKVLYFSEFLPVEESSESESSSQPESSESSVPDSSQPESSESSYEPESSESSIPESSESESSSEEPSDPGSEDTGSQENYG